MLIVYAIDGICKVDIWQLFSSGFNIHCKLLRGGLFMADYPVYFSARSAQMEVPVSWLGRAKCECRGQTGIPASTKHVADI